GAGPVSEGVRPQVAGEDVQATGHVDGGGPAEPEPQLPGASHTLGRRGSDETGRGGVFAWFIDWATGPAGQTQRPPIVGRPRQHPVLTLVAGTVSALLVAASTVFGVLGSGTTTVPPLQTLPTPIGPGDPILAARLSKQADGLNRTDPLTELQLRIAARTLDPGNTAYRSTL